MIFLYIALALVLAAVAAAYVCYRIAFYSPPRTPIGPDEYPIPEGEEYEAFREQMVGWMKEVRQLPHENVQIQSHDGLTLRGRYYEYAPGAPIELMFHGYRGNPERDLCGGIQRCFSIGRSILLVEQRASAQSDGKVISFGINESKDCHRWVDFMLQKFGPDVKIILTGVSMGAATVVMAAGKPLPKNVIGVLADCGYTSAKDIIRKEIRKMHLPPTLSYPFVKLGARIFGGFDLDEDSPIEAAKRCTVPVIFYHGESDDFVPCEMSRRVFDACASRKRLVTIPGAGHGLSYPVAPEYYLATLWEFFGPEASSALHTPPFETRQ